jgi:hypothetical protein
MVKKKEIIRCCICGRTTKEGICNPCIEKAKKEYKEIEDNWRTKNV